MNLKKKSSRHDLNVNLIMDRDHMFLYHFLSHRLILVVSYDASFFSINYSNFEMGGALFPS